MKNKTIISINNRFNELNDRCQIEITHLINSIASHKYNDYVQKNVLSEINNLYTKIHNLYIEDYKNKLAEKRKKREAKNLSNKLDKRKTPF